MIVAVFTRGASEADVVEDHAGADHHRTNDVIRNLPERRADAPTCIPKDELHLLSGEAFCVPDDLPGGGVVRLNIPDFDDPDAQGYQWVHVRQLGNADDGCAHGSGHRSILIKNTEVPFPLPKISLRPKKKVRQEIICLKVRQEIICLKERI